MTLKLKTQILHGNILNDDVRGKILQFLLWSFGLLSLGYVLFLGDMVFNIVGRRSLETQARALGNEVGSLELSYIAMSSNIDLDLSHTLGFKETKINFATRKSLGSLGNIKVSQNEI